MANGSIYVGFSKAPGIISKAIRWVTRSDVSHASIAYVDSTWGGWWVAEATAQGVHTRPMHKNIQWVYAYEVRYDISLDMDIARRYFDEHYDYIGATALGCMLLLGRLLHRKIRAPFHSASGQFCSEFIAGVLQHVLDGKNPQWITPKMLQQICADKANYFRPVDVSLFKSQKY